MSPALQADSLPTEPSGKPRIRQIQRYQGNISCTVMGSIKDRNGMDLTEAEDIKKRRQEYTEELYTKDLHDQITMV